MAQKVKSWELRAARIGRRVVRGEKVMGFPPRNDRGTSRLLCLGGGCLSLHKHSHKCEANIDDYESMVIGIIFKILTETQIFDIRLPS